MLTKVRIVKATVFPVVMYRYESWTVKKAEHWRTDAFELWRRWRRLLRVPWTSRRSNKSILKEISPEYSLEGLMLKLQYFGYLMWRANKLEKTLMLGEIEGKRRKGWQSMRWLDSITDSVEIESCSVMSNFLLPHGLYSTWNSPSQNTRVGSLSLPQGIFPIQGLNPGLLHCKRILYQLSYEGRYLTNSMYMNLSRLWEIVKEKGAWLVTVHGVAESNAT